MELLPISLGTEAKSFIIKMFFEIFSVTDTLRLNLQQGVKVKNSDYSGKK